MSMVKLDKPIHQLSKDECLSILKYHVDAFGCTAAEYYSLKDSEILISIIDRLNEITEEIKPRILYVLTKNVPTDNYLTELIQPRIFDLGIDDYKLDSNIFYPKIGQDDISDLSNSCAVLLDDNNSVELFKDIGNTKDYKDTVSTALTDLVEFYCTQLTIYP